MDHLISALSDKPNHIIIAFSGKAANEVTHEAIGDREDVGDDLEVTEVDPEADSGA